MITVRDLQLMLDQAIHHGQVRLDSEVRLITNSEVSKHKDCSLEPAWCVTAPGFDHNGVPLDKRFGAGAFHLAQECEFTTADEQLLVDLDWR